MPIPLPGRSYLSRADSSSTDHLSRGCTWQPSTGQWRRRIVRRLHRPDPAGTARARAARDRPLAPRLEAHELGHGERGRVRTRAQARRGGCAAPPLRAARGAAGRDRRCTAPARMSTALRAAIDERMPADGDREVGGPPSLTASAQRALLDAYQVARAYGSTYIDPEHLFFAFLVTRTRPRAGCCRRRASRRRRCSAPPRRRSATRSRRRRAARPARPSTRTPPPPRSTSSASTSPRAPARASSTR